MAKKSLTSGYNNADTKKLIRQINRIAKKCNISSTTNSLYFEFENPTQLSKPISVRFSDHFPKKEATVNEIQILVNEETSMCTVEFVYKALTMPTSSVFDKFAAFINSYDILESMFNSIRKEKTIAIQKCGIQANKIMKLNNTIAKMIDTNSQTNQDLVKIKEQMKLTAILINGFNVKL